MGLTIAYMTCRQNPRFEWFRDSLLHQNPIGIVNRIVVVDFHAATREPKLDVPGIETIVTTPKPTVWQGPHRLTKRDYFAAANARNTALCYAKDGWIAYVDDLSVLMPGWLKCVREAMQGNYIALGAYRKVLKLQVENGEVKYLEDHPSGWDSRWKHGNDAHPVPAAGGWLFGASVAMPVETLLKINGWDEDCDSLGGEDYIAGLMLEKHGYRFMYDRRMLTLESEELHHYEVTLTRIDKGKSPKDKSHKILKMVTDHGRHRAPNYFGNEGIAGLRQRVLRGEPFPIPSIPEHDWYDDQPLREM